jgi:hypothetical protein
MSTNEDIEEFEDVAEHEQPSDEYQKYLFAMLWHGRHPELDLMEYDHAYENISREYELFIKSDHNSPNVSLYEAIDAYFDEQLETETRVFFRKVINSPMAGSVIAIFPDEIADKEGNFMSYMHVGQHSAASTEFVVKDTIATKFGCDMHGCMETHLRDVIGYDDLVVCDDPMEIGFTPKCLYCDSGAEPTHFTCESCGDGMCEACYMAEVEHDGHYQSPAESADGEEQYLIMDDSFGDGYACDSCVSKAILMERNMEESQ